jgi:hypothetical protein
MRFCTWPTPKELGDKTMRITSRFLAVALAVGVALSASAFAQGINVLPTINFPAQSFTLTGQTSTALPVGVSGLSYATVMVTEVPLTSAVAAPTIVASDTSVYPTATYSTVGNSDTLSGTLKIQVTGGTAFTVTIPAGTTLAQAVTLLNANTTFNSTNSLTASTSTHYLIFTGGAYGAGGSKTIIDNTSVLVDTQPISAVVGILGSNDGGTTFFPLNMASILAAGTLATTETVTASSLFAVNLAGITHFKFVTSGTFTAASISVKVTGTSVKGIL